MDFKFEWDDRALKKFANEAIGDVRREAQAEFDRLHRQHAGKPAGAIEPHVRRAFRRLGFKASEAEVRDYAQTISAGTRVVFRPGKFR